MANVKLTTKSRYYCGGYFVFVKICQRGKNDCCEEEIVKNGIDGFNGGDIIENKLKKCSTFMTSHINDMLEAKLTGWGEKEVRFNHF